MRSRDIKFAVACCWIGVCGVWCVEAAPLWGRAIAVSLRGEASYESDYDTGALEEGMALCEGHRIALGSDSGLCCVLTPGALMHFDERSVVMLDTLQHRAAGVPASEPARTIIRLTLQRGAILLDAEKVAAKREIVVSMPGDIELRATQGEFVMSVDRSARKVRVDRGECTLMVDGVTRSLSMGDDVLLRWLEAGDTGRWILDEADPHDAFGSDFYVCRQLSSSLATYAFDWKWGKSEDLAQWIGSARRLSIIGDPSVWQDVSPSMRPARKVAPQTSGDTVRRPDRGMQRRPEIWNWYRRTGELRGVNYVPRTAVNAIEMWSRDRFDSDVVDEELGWAHDAGLNSVRVFLPYTVWRDDAEGLKERMNQFLDIADQHELSTAFVLFDGRRAPGMVSHSGPQGDPIPGRHNSRWAASPDYSLVSEESGEWPRLKRYVQDIVSTFAGDRRVLMWDVFSEVGHHGLDEDGLQLLFKTLDWVRAEEPSQPVTAEVAGDLTMEARGRIVARTDVVTITHFDDAESLRMMLAHASARGRPVICTGWLSRRRECTFEEILPVFSEFRTGWFHWGLVKGRSQLYEPRSGERGQSSVWDQDLLHPDGTPYREEEIRLIRGFAFSTN